MRSDLYTLIVCLTGLAGCADTAAGPPPAPGGVAIVAGDGQQQAAGVPVRLAPTVRVTDADGRPMRGIPVTFAATRYAAVDPVVAVTGADGIASTTWTLRTDGGEDTVLAKVDSLAPAEFHATSMVFMEISAGSRGTCAVMTGGRAFCWGANQHGQLGTGDTLDHWLPTAVAGGERYSEYFLGGSMSCGINAGGQLRCAGRAPTLNGPVYGASPQPEGGALRFSTIAPSSGDLFCGLEQSATSYCWGWVYDYLVPSDTVPGARSLFRIVPGGAATQVSVVTPPSPFSVIEKVCVVRPGGGIECYNATLEFTQAFPPVPAVPILEVSPAPLGVCWLDPAFTAWCQDQSTFPAPAPTTIVLPATPRALEPADYRTCALTDLGVYCWDNFAGGTGPALEPGTTGMQFRSLSVAADHRCAIDDHARAWCWGANDHGQLGDGTTDSSAVPRLVKFAL